MKKLLLSNSGVSLIELVIAVAILSIIASFAATALYAGVKSENKNSVTRQNVEDIAGALDTCFDTTSTGTDMTVTVNFPASASENVDCTKIMDSVYGMDIGIVKVK